ncbi:sulfotransferase [Novosphingobium aerophilum]|uniref:sulfotransferase n=1 Tax=Novosphingobium aerophilum TaxID=2839843 RepID=UPI003FD69268
MSVHLVHVGYPKTGSTYLQSWFSRHPDILFEPYHLGGSAGPLRFAWQAVCGEAGKARVTSCEDLSVPAIRPEDWPRMAQAQRAVCDHLHALFPSAHILIITRGWREVIRSAHSQLVAMGWHEQLETFLASPAAQSVIPVVMDYDRLVSWYRELFGERVTVLPYELLRADPAAFLAVVEGILGVVSGPISAAAENVRLSQAELNAYPRIANAIRKLPSRKLRKALTLLHVRMANSRLGPHVARLVDRMVPVSAITELHLPDPVLQEILAGSTRLVEDPCYRDYAALYTG